MNRTAAVLALAVALAPRAPHAQASASKSAPQEAKPAQSAANRQRLRALISSEKPMPSAPAGVARSARSISASSTKVPTKPPSAVMIRALVAVV